MTVPVQTTFTSSVANGATTVFPYGFMIADEADIKVELDGVVQTTGFTVSGVGNVSGGNITFSVAPANGVKVLRYLDPVLTRETDYQQFGDFLAAVVNLDFDRVWLAMQSLTARADRSIKLPVDTTDEQLISDNAAARAGKLLGFDDDGNAALKSAVELGILVVTPFAESLLDDTNAAGARATLGAMENVSPGSSGNIMISNGSTWTSQSAPSPTDQVARDQIALTNMRLMLNSAVTTGALVQGKQWELATDEWATGSSNYSLTTGTPGYYKNVTATSFTVSGSSGWTTYASSSISGATITLGTAAGGTANTRRNTADLVGDFDFYYTQQNDTQYGYSATYGDTYQFGFSVGAPGTTNPPWENNSSNDWYIGYTPTALGSSCTVRLLQGQTVRASAAQTISAGDVIKLSRRGNVLTVYRNGVSFLSYTGASTSDGVPYVGRGTNSTGTNTFGSVGWDANYATSNATLLSPAVSVSSAPTYMDAYCLWKDDSGSAVLGTDFTVELSRDGGTTYAAAALSSIADFDGTYTTLKARADVSGQPSGTSMKCRIKTFNTKAQRVAAPALYAE